jgi:hypothetical protein
MNEALDSENDNEILIYHYQSEINKINDHLNSLNFNAELYLNPEFFIFFNVSVFIFLFFYFLFFIFLNICNNMKSFEFSWINLS